MSMKRDLKKAVRLSHRMTKALANATEPKPSIFAPPRRQQDAALRLQGTLVARGMASTLQGLERRGLVKCKFIAYTGTLYFLTPEGRAARDSILGERA